MLQSKKPLDNMTHKDAVLFVINSYPLDSLKADGIDVRIKKKHPMVLWASVDCVDGYIIISDKGIVKTINLPPVQSTKWLKDHFIIQKQ